MTDNVRKPSAKRDSLLAHCLVRAVIAAEGREKLEEQLAAGDLQVTAWTGAKATPKASRVATFIVLWAKAMHDERLEEFSITEYQRYWRESERQAYRLQREFRELWPEFDTPNDLAPQIVSHLAAKKATKREIASLPMTLQVRA